MSKIIIDVNNTIFMTNLKHHDLLIVEDWYKPTVTFEEVLFSKSRSLMRTLDVSDDDKYKFMVPLIDMELYLDVRYLSHSMIKYLTLALAGKTFDEVIIVETAPMEVIRRNIKVTLLELLDHSNKLSFKFFDDSVDKTNFFLDNVNSENILITNNEIIIEKLLDIDSVSKILNTIMIPTWGWNIYLSERIHKQTNNRLRIEYIKGIEGFIENVDNMEQIILNM